MLIQGLSLPLRSLIDYLYSFEVVVIPTVNLSLRKFSCNSLKELENLVGVYEANSLL